MEAIISNLLDRFEKGSLTRRGLVQGLALLTAAGAAEAQATGGISEPLRSTTSASKWTTFPSPSRSIRKYLTSPF